MKKQSNQDTVFTDFYSKSYRRFLGYASQFNNILVRHSMEPSDLVVEASIKAYKNFHTFVGNRVRFIAWMKTIIHNTAINISRKKSMNIIDVTDHLAQRLLLHNASHHKESREYDGMSFDEMIKYFPEHQREALTLFCKDGYTIEEISKKLDLPISTVKSRIYRRNKKQLPKLRKKVYE